MALQPDPAESSFLDLEAYLGGTFLHPGGREATRWLLDVIAAGPPVHRLLELGCGTGSTTELVARENLATVVAVDRSPAMLRAAQDRLHVETRPGGAATPALVQADVNRPLPFANGQFDLIYAESVFALLDVPQALRECVRVLRPGGRLVLNERIWKPGQSRDEVDEVNAASMRVFGIPAATEQPWDWQDWQDLLWQAGLQDVEVMPVDALLGHRPRPVHAEQRLMRLRRYVSRPAAAVRSLRYKSEIRRWAALWVKMECYLFQAHRQD